MIKNAHPYMSVCLFFFISKKKILLIKARETQKVHGSEQWKKEATRQKQPLYVSMSICIC